MRKKVWYRVVSFSSKENTHFYSKYFKTLGEAQQYLEEEKSRLLKYGPLPASLFLYIEKLEESGAWEEV